MKNQVRRRRVLYERPYIIYCRVLRQIQRTWLLLSSILQCSACSAVQRLQTNSRVITKRLQTKELLSRAFACSAQDLMPLDDETMLQLTKAAGLAENGQCRCTTGRTVVDSLACPDLHFVTEQYSLLAGAGEGGRVTEPVFLDFMVRQGLSARYGRTYFRCGTITPT